jgi:hypothetical protein
MEKRTFDRFSKSLFQNQPGFGTSSWKIELFGKLKLPDKSAENRKIQSILQDL